MATTGQYGKLVRAAMDSPRNATGAVMSVRQLAEAVNRSYEHCRRLVGGEPVASRALNDDICRVLGLDPWRMWQVALADKARRRYGLEFSGVPSRDLAAIWPNLSRAAQDKVLGFARILLEDSVDGGGGEQAQPVETLRETLNRIVGAAQEGGLREGVANEAATDLGDTAEPSGGLDRRRPMAAVGEGDDSHSAKARTRARMSEAQRRRWEQRRVADAKLRGETGGSLEKLLPWEGGRGARSK